MHQVPKQKRHAKPSISLSKLFAWNDITTEWSSDFTWMRIFPKDMNGVLNSVVNRQPTKKSPSPLLKNWGVRLCLISVVMSSSTITCWNTTFGPAHQSDGKEDDEQGEMVEDQQPLLHQEWLQGVKRMAAIGATVTLDLLDVKVAQIHREDVKSHIRSSKQ